MGQRVQGAAGIGVQSISGAEERWRIGVLWGRVAVWEGRGQLEQGQGGGGSREGATPLVRRAGTDQH